MLSRLKTSIMQFKWKAPFQRPEESAEVMEMLTEVTEDVPTAKKRWLNEKAQKKLLETLRNNDFEAFTSLLKKDVNVDHVYENQHTLLIEACAKEESGKEACGKEAHGKGPEKYVKALLAANADPNLRDNEGRTALHWAAAESNDKCTQLLLDDSRTNANVWSDLGYTPLHCATLAFWDNAHAGSHARCIQMLMERQDLEVNRPDKFGDPAIWNSLQHPEADAAQILKVILKCKHSRLNVDVWHMRNGSTIRKVIETKFPKLKDLLPQLSECETGSGRIMQMLLQPNPDLEEFSSALPEDIDTRFEDPYYCTPLELACRRKDLKGFVKVLLDAKANPEQSTEMYDFPVLHQAMANANFDALKTMISYRVDFGIKTRSQHTVLHIAAHRHCTTREEELEMERCVNLVLGREDDKSNGGGGGGGRWRDGAAAADARPLVDVHARDEGGDTALHDAAQYGQQHVALPLLRSGANVLLRDDDQRTPLDLLDAATLRLFLDEHVRGSGRPRSDDYQITMRYKFLVSQDKNIPEIETAYHISRSRHLRELLQHPVIRSFLDLKWHIIRWIFYINVVVYLLFVLLFTTYVLIINEDYDTTSCAILNDEFEGSIPVSRLIEDISVVSSKCEMQTNYCSWNSTHICTIDVDVRIDNSMLVLRILCTFFLAALSLIEIMQFVTGPLRYVTDSENFIEILTIFICACAVSCDFNTSNLKQHISAIAVLITWLELVLLTGRLPAFSIQLEVLKKVSFTFLRFMAWYSLLVIAFVFSFYILFRQRGGNEEEFFENPAMTVLRTVAMMIGELEASSLKFDKVQITSHVIFLGFVFLIIIILMNVLSGLAVSDTQAIVDDAKVQRLVSLVKLISYCERIVRRLCLGKDFCLKYIQPMFIVFPSNAHGKKVYFNKDGNVTFPHLHKESKEKYNDDFSIEEDIVENAITILSDNNQATDMDLVMNLLNTLTEELGKCQKGREERK